ncbi:unnamed protein product [Schistocephalus solidus]|uniref:Lactamase_B domain-containing protein n=1 Tax=Schistocephalus solidus TaxID=70667 RepID=A0A183SWH2_SCHSO|nr:unnamed protein product [Schistocephalus solidus]
MDIIFLGTGSAFPTPKRAVSGMILRNSATNVQWLFDCGEGSQVQAQKIPEARIKRITRIFITHMHGDHVYGLPGLMATLAHRMQGEERGPDDVDVEIYGPQGLRRYLRLALSLAWALLDITYTVHELMFSPKQTVVQDYVKFASTKIHPDYDPILPYERPGRDIYPDENAATSEEGFPVCVRAAVVQPIPGKKPSDFFIIVQPMLVVWTIKDVWVDGVGRLAPLCFIRGVARSLLLQGRRRSLILVLTKRRFVQSSGWQIALVIGNSCRSLDENVAQQLPTPRSGVHPCCLRPCRKADGVGQQEVMFNAVFFLLPALGLWRNIFGPEGPPGPVGEVKTTFTVHAVPLRHTVPSVGWLLVESPSPPRMMMEKVNELGVPPGPLLGKLKKGQIITFKQDGVDVTVSPDQVVGPGIRGRRIAICGDSGDSSALADLLRLEFPNEEPVIDTLVHEATVLSAHGEHTYEKGHTSAAEAAKFAASIGVRQLILTHFSQRYISYPPSAPTNGDGSKRTFKKSHFPIVMTLFYDILPFQLAYLSTPRSLR